MTFPTAEPAEYDLAAVLHLLIDHGRLPDEVTAKACHQAVTDWFVDPYPLGSVASPDTPASTEGDTPASTEADATSDATVHAHLTP